MYNLTGKVALVTGAGGRRGMGRAIACRLAAEGADLVVTDIVAQTDTADWHGLPDVISQIEAMGRQALGLVADVSSAQQVEAMVRQTLDHFGHIDILVNNAGASAGDDRVPVVELTEAAWDRVNDVNAKGTFLCCRAVARSMIERGRGGRIINLSSTSGKIGVPRYAAYCASKFAVRGFTQALAHELAPYGINVNAVCPGLTETERIEDMAAALAPEGVTATDHRRRMVQTAGADTPLGRVAQGADIARTVAFLASAESDYLTGLSINVAGGFLMD